MRDQFLGLDALQNGQHALASEVTPRVLRQRGDARVSLRALWSKRIERNDVLTSALEDFSLRRSGRFRGVSPSDGVQARGFYACNPSGGTAMKHVLRRTVALALAGAVSLGLLNSVASLAASDRAALAQARQAQAVLVAARADALRR